MATELAEKKTTSQMTIREQLNSPEQKEEFRRAMPKHCDPDRMVRVALTAMTKTPKLSQCTKPSFFLCMLNLSQWGLEPDGRRAHLIPYKNGKLSSEAGRDVYDCTLIIDYKGLVELAYRAGVVRAIHADVVRRGDVFKYSSGYITEHIPWFLRDPSERPKDAGEIYAAYCVAQLKDGTAKHEVVSKEDIEAIRKRSKSGNNGPWVTDWSEMAKKTVFRRLSKWLPLSADIIEAFHGDDDGLAELTVKNQAKRIAVSDLSAVLSPAETVVDTEPANEGIDEPAQDEVSQVADDSPAGAAEPLAVYRSKVRAEFGLIAAPAKLRVRYDALVAEQGMDVDHESILTEEYERRIQDIEAAKKK